MKRTVKQEKSELLLLKDQTVAVLLDGWEKALVCVWVPVKGVKLFFCLRSRAHWWVIYLSNLPTGRIWLLVILLWRALHKSRHMCSSHKKCLIPLAYSYWSASGAKQWTQPSKADMAWEWGQLLETRCSIF